MADITINDSAGKLLSNLDSKDGTTVADLLEMLGAGVLKKDGVLKANKNCVLVAGTYTLGPPQHWNSPVGNSSLMDAFKGLQMEMHSIRETLPRVLVGHVISPSEASKKPPAVATVFDALGLNLTPRNNGTTYQLPNTCGPEWIFSWRWPTTVTDD